MSSRLLNENLRKQNVIKMMDKRQLSLNIKAEAKNLGFFACGIARAAAVD